MALAGNLYSGDFYKQAFRVLQERGRMFHYIGDPNSAAGSKVTRGVVKRLHDAGFKKVISLAKAFGVVANK
jgi:predicted methyltransferase